MPQIAATLAGSYRLDPLAQFVESQRMAADVVVIDQIVADQHVHEPERERGIGARQQRNVRMAFFRRERAVGIDGDRAAPRGAWPAARAPRNARSR